MKRARFAAPTRAGRAARTARIDLMGFTLIELLVALAAMALMAGLSWRGLDGMIRAKTQIEQRADAVLALQAGLTQWTADLDALLSLPQTQTLDWDGRGLRIVRRSTARPGDGVLVVAWSRRSINGVDQWLRWQSPPQYTRGELQTAWARAAQWAQNPGDAEKRDEVRITPGPIPCPATAWPRRRPSRPKRPQRRKLKNPLPAKPSCPMACAWC